MGERKVSIKWMPGNAAPQTLSNLPHVGHTGMMRKTSQGRARVETEDNDGERGKCR